MSDQALQPPLVAAVRPTRRRRISAGLVVRYAALVGTLILTIFPLAWLVITSLRYSSEIFATPVHMIPGSVTFSQYVAVFSQYGLANYLWNTIIVSLATVVTVTLLSVPCAYAIARFRLPGQKLVVSLLLIMRMIPVVALAIPLFAVFAKVGMLDTLSALILTHTAAKLPIAIWLLMGFIQDLPKEIEESALMDGAGTLPHPGADREPAHRPGHRRQRRHHLPLHLERPADRLDSDFQRKGADATGRPHQLRVRSSESTGAQCRLRASSWSFRRLFSSGSRKGCS